MSRVGATDNPVAAALGRVRGARAAAVACALVLVLDLVAVHRANQDDGHDAARVLATRTGLRGADASPSVADLPAAVDPTLPATDPLSGVLGQPAVAASTASRERASTATAAGGAAGAPATEPRPSGPLAFGTYSLAVTGSESLTGFGTRTLPSRATLTARPAGENRARVELVLSKDHREHAVLAYGRDGITRAAEGSTVVFGGVPRTSEADLVPAIAEVPLPLQATTLRGTTVVRGRDGTPSRTDDWTTQIAGQETLVMGTTPVVLWVVKVERRTATDASEQARRTSTFWFDPARRTWVKWRENLRVDRKSLGVPSTYEARYEATLAGFKPA